MTVESGQNKELIGSDPDPFCCKVTDLTTHTVYHSYICNQSVPQK